MKYKFCPKCAGELVTFLDIQKERLKCSKCSFVFYENSKPCATAVILDGNKVLLGRRSHDPMKGGWDLIGGFLESGEYPEDGLRRETKEETGLDVLSTKLLGMFMDRYPDYDYDTLNIAYLCEVKGTPKASDDVSELQWFDLNNIPELAFKNTRQTIEVLKAYLKNQPGS